MGACPPPPACGCLSSPRPAAPRNCSLVRDASRSAPSPSEDCGWLSLDRRGRRRWCSMATCGSRRQQTSAGRWRVAPWQGLCPSRRPGSVSRSSPRHGAAHACPYEGVPM
ncbi:CGNR zinc finger domain-containing protein [Streptomyces sp. NPDC056653]|uniref:CGNR zinc finger domain-containing protein n=1 Tax=Streptomyces sp. NPDC056653 TaxID=3345894 RepID=UPI00368AA0F2